MNLKNWPILALLAVLLCTGCFRAELPDLSQLPERPADFPDQHYLDLASMGWDVYSVTQSELIVSVYKEGQLANLGHNHIISSGALSGLVAVSPQGQVELDLFLPVVELEVDRPELRKAAGDAFDSEPSEDDINGTRANMLSEKLLDALSHPFVKISSRTNREARQLPMSVSLAGQQAELEIPITYSLQQRLEVDAAFSLSHSDFGITPFSVFGGALRVSDGLDARLSLVAEPLEIR